MENLIDSKIGKNINKKPREHASLKEQLLRQVKFLNSSAKLFDAGDHDEANRLATTLRVLLHDTENSKSLLGQLGIKEKLRFVDTGLYRARLDDAMNKWAQQKCPGWVIAAIKPGEAGLVEIGINPDGMAGWKAPLREQRLHPLDPKASAFLSPQPFDAWWKTPLVEDSKLKQFSRMDLVLIMANQDGGAHVDPKLDKDYSDLCEDYLGVQMGFGDPDKMMDIYPALPPAANNVAFASVRQIAYEVILTLDRYNSNLVKTGGA